MELLVVILIVLMFFWVNSLSNKITRLRLELDALRSGQPLPPPQAPQHQATMYAPQMQTPVVAPQQAVPAMQATAPEYQQQVALVDDKFMAWLKQDFFVKLGALLLLIAFGWFVSYAFANQWIGPVGRIALGLIAGASLMIAGIWRIKNYLHQGSIFTVLGSTTILLTVFAAREIYGFFDPLSALGIMFLSVAFVAFVSIKYKNEPLAIVSLLLAAVAPFLTAAPTPDVVGLFTYWLVIVLGSLWVVRLTGSQILMFVAFLLTVLYGMPFIGGLMGETERYIALLFAFIFTAIFFVGNMVSILLRDNEDARQIQLITAFGTGLYVAAWIFFAGTPELQSLLFVAWMLVFGVGAFVVFKRSQNKVPFYVYGAISFGLLAAATAAELDGPLLAIAYIVEAAMAVALARILAPKTPVSEGVSWLFLIPIILSVGSIVSSAWRTGFMHADFVVLSLLAFTLGLLALFLKERARIDGYKAQEQITVFGVASAVYVVVLIWLVLHSVLPDTIATMFSLIIYAVCGFVLFVHGRLLNNKFTSGAGAILLGLVVARLLIVDVWDMELAGRIITFFAIGLLLMSTAFIRPPKKGMSD